MKKMLIETEIPDELASDPDRIQDELDRLRGLQDTPFFGRFRVPSLRTEGLFCVVGQTVQNRTWLKTIDTAVAHARRLLVSGMRKTPASAADRLLVVQVVKVVELEDPPVVIRDPGLEEVGS